MHEYVHKGCSCSGLGVWEARRFLVLHILSSLTLIWPESVVLRPEELAVGLFGQGPHLTAVHAVKPVLTGRRAFDEAAVGHVVRLPCPQTVLAGLTMDQERARDVEIHFMQQKQQTGSRGIAFPQGSKRIKCKVVLDTWNLDWRYRYKIQVLYLENHKMYL